MKSYLRSLLRWCVAAALLLTLAASASAQSDGDKKKVVVPFDLVSKYDKGKLGQKVGEMIWKKIERQKTFIVPDTVQDIRDVCSQNNLKIGPDTPQEKVREAVRTAFDAQIGIWGSVELVAGNEGEIYDLVLHCVDFSTEKPAVIYEKTVRTKAAAEIPNLYVKEMIDKLHGRKPEAEAPKNSDPAIVFLPLPNLPPEAEQRWKDGKNLAIGGDFETPSKIKGVPLGWESRCGQKREPLGRLVVWTTEKENPSNHILRFNLDKSTGENEGIMYYSRAIPVKEGAIYRFQVRFRTDGPWVKVFLKCYDEVPSDYKEEEGAASQLSMKVEGNEATATSQGMQLREVYRSQQTLFGSMWGNKNGCKGPWNTHTEDFSPKHGRYHPHLLRIDLYAYVMAGTIEWDDVVLKEIVPPPADAGVKDLKHSMESKVTLQEMRENEARAAEAQRIFKQRQEEKKKALEEKKKKKKPAKDDEN